MTAASGSGPFGYHLCPPVPEPPFADAGELERVWGRRWGAPDEVGRLRTVLVRRPQGEWRVVRADCWDERAQALVDPAGMWYWESRDVPDHGRVAEQHAGLVEALRRAGVEVVFVEEPGPPHLTRPIYTRDPLVTVPGGAIIGRLAPAMRRGEEPLVTRAVAALGMPILHTITGTGLVEGGSFVKLRPGVAAYGTSFRCNPEGARQLAAACAELAIELDLIDLPESSIHLDGHLGMVAPDLALVDPGGLPETFLARLRGLEIEPIPCPEGEEWAINSLVLGPRLVLMCDGYPQTRRLLEARGIEVRTIAYDEIQKGGGGIHCSTMELVRDPA